MKKLRNIVNIKTVVFVSPHFDDVILSCADIIKRLKFLDHEIEIITIFGGIAKPPFSGNVGWILKKSGFLENQSYFATRIFEDIQAARTLGVKRSQFNFFEGVYRKRISLFWLEAFLPEQLAYRYPTMPDIFRAKERRNENSLQKMIVNRLQRYLLKKYADTQLLLMLPLGIGQHADHQIIQTIPTDRYKTYYYGEYPYMLNYEYQKQHNNYELVYERKFKSQQKEKLLQLYKSQYFTLFPKSNRNSFIENLWQKSE